MRHAAERVVGSHVAGSIQLRVSDEGVVRLDLPSPLDAVDGPSEGRLTPHLPHAEQAILSVSGQTDALIRELTQESVV